MTPKLASATFAAVLLLCSGLAQAQATPGAASAPAGRMGMGMGGMHGAQMNRDNTAGWAMMTEAERQAHHDKMTKMTDHAACSTYLQEHHAQMAARAKERGLSLPATPRRDACAPLTKK